MLINTAGANVSGFDKTLNLQGANKNKILPLKNCITPRGFLLSHIQ